MVIKDRVSVNDVQKGSEGDVIPFVFLLRGQLVNALFEGNVC